MTTKQATNAQVDGKVKTFPAPSQSATITDLTPQQVEAVTNAVNPLIADAFALYVKTKNYHWHMSGSHFREYHLLLDKQAEVVLDSIDVMAERIRRIGGTTIRSISMINQTQTIQDDNSEFVAPGEMLKRLMEDDNHIAKLLRNAAETCEDNHDIATANQLEDILNNIERYKWFLFETIQGMDNTI